MLKIGDKVEVLRMPEGSFYKKARGTVTGIDAKGWVNIKATEIVDKWSTKWEQHPTSCMTSARIENLISY